MPNWLREQLMKAFHQKNRRQIRLLNECWYYYTKIITKKNEWIS